MTDPTAEPVVVINVEPTPLHPEGQWQEVYTVPAEPSQRDQYREALAQQYSTAKVVSERLATCRDGMNHDLKATGHTHITAINPVLEPDAARAVYAELKGAS